MYRFLNGTGSGKATGQGRRAANDERSGKITNRSRAESAVGQGEGQEEINVLIIAALICFCAALISDLANSKE